MPSSSTIENLFQLAEKLKKKNKESACDYSCGILKQQYVRDQEGKSTMRTERESSRTCMIERLIGFRNVVRFIDI